MLLWVKRVSIAILIWIELARPPDLTGALVLFPVLPTHLVLSFALPCFFLPLFFLNSEQARLELGWSSVEQPAVSQSHSGISKQLLALLSRAREELERVNAK